MQFEEPSIFLSDEEKPDIENGLELVKPGITYI